MRAVLAIFFVVSLCGLAVPSSAQTSGDSIQFDRFYYNWTAKARIIIKSPGSNLNRSLRDVIGSGKNGRISIRTRKSQLANYRFVETGENTGVFLGVIQLTGFPHDIDGDGVSDIDPRTGGKGPTDGRIPIAERGDGLTVYWQPGSGLAKPICDDKNYGNSRADIGWDPAARAQNRGDCIAKEKAPKEAAPITQTVPVGWTHAKLEFDRTVYPIGSIARIRVEDIDMNLNPDKQDTVKLFVFTESDITGVQLTAFEDSKNPGVFEARVLLTDQKDLSGAGEGSLFKDEERPGSASLRATSQVKVIAMYEDRTLPKPYAKSGVNKIQRQAKMSAYSIQQNQQTANLAQNVPAGAVLVPTNDPYTPYKVSDKCPPGMTPIPHEGTQMCVPNG
ncbi:MAG: hypothetical protein ABIJ96_18235 [Elusimicrobiota bacterium]